MKFAMKTAWAVLVLAFAAPAAAQSDNGVACLGQEAGDAMAAKLVDGFLAGRTLENESADIRNLMIAASDRCTEKHAVPEARQTTFLSASISRMLGDEIRRRLVAMGVDMTPTEVLLLRLASDPELPIADYIDARPQEFEVPTKKAADANNVSQDLILQLLGGYIGMKLEGTRAAEQLRGQ